MPVHTIRIDDRLWSSASPLRKQEWLTLAADIIAGEPPWPSREPCELIAGCDDSHIRFKFTSSADLEDELALARAELAELVHEYVGVIEKLSDGDLHPTHIETLDMAKRVVHDAGGRKLGALLPDLSPSLETRRRFFSLVVSLAVDTTRFGAAPAHRRHAQTGFASLFYDER
jgi:uncharacterized protein (UPF0262 family)